MNTTLIYFIIGWSIGFLLFVLIGMWLTFGKCSKCQERYYYSSAKIVPSNAASSFKETKVERRDGNKAIELIRYPLCREWNCKKCDTISYSWVWSTSFWDWTKPHRDQLSFWQDRLAKAEWEEEGEPFDVIDCPMCNGNGSLNVTIDAHVDAQFGFFNGSDVVYRREQYGRGLCGFCNGQGCVKPEKLDSLQRK
jgi:hypothetical protein